MQTKAFWQSMKKNIPKMLVIFALSGILLVASGFLLNNNLLAADICRALDLLAIGGFLWGFLSLFVGAKAGALFSGVFMGLAVLTGVGSLWASILALLIAFGGPLGYAAYQRRKVKKQLLEADPDLSEAQAREVVRALQSVQRHPAEELLQYSRYLLEKQNLVAVREGKGRRAVHSLMQIDSDTAFFYHVATPDEEGAIAQKLAGDGGLPETPDKILHGVKSIILSRRASRGELYVTIVTAEGQHTLTCTGTYDGHDLLTHYRSLGMPISLAKGTRLPSPWATMDTESLIHEAKEREDSDTDRRAFVRRAAICLPLASVLCFALALPNIRNPLLFTVLWALELLAPLAALLLYARFPGEVRMDSNREGLPHLVVAIVLPPALPALLLLLLHEARRIPLRWGVIIPVAAGMGLALIVTACRLMRERERKGSMVGICFFYLIYSVVVGFSVNLFVQIL